MRHLPLNIVLLGYIALVVTVVLMLILGGYR